VEDVAINPSPAELGRVNAVVGGRGARYESRFTGPLSLKSVLSGRAVWETREGRFEVLPGSVLVLGDGDEYELTIDALQPVETFCLFFARGFVEDVWRATITGSGELLDAAPRGGSVALAEKLHFDAPLVAEMRRAAAGRDAESLAEAFRNTALELVRAQCAVAARIERLPALKASTREELARRVAVATAWLHANLDRPVALEEAARIACLSPFHFHRLFTAMYGTTPHRYVTRLRLERARAALRCGDRSVTAVALDCGFESVGSFTTLFRRTFGETPGEIRKNGEVPAAPRALPSRS
jgi:AraC-like DNA-binding protein